MDCSGQGRHRDCQRRLLGRRGARLYCEDKDIAPATPDGIRDSIFAAYRSCNTSPAFKEGFRAFELAIASCCNPYENRTGRPADLNAHAWSGGMNAAIFYQFALAYLYAAPTDDDVPETTAACWLIRIIRGEGPLV
jgi:hypothetical protein